MSFTFSRRILLRITALGTVGLGGITVLSACGNTSQNSAERSSYKGEAKLDSYDTSAGTYELASREHPARNVPKPVKPNNMNDNSVAGLYSTIAFFAAALQYRLITGDAQYLKEVKLEHTVDSIEEITNGSTWLSNPTVTIELTTDQPEQKDNEYFWPAKLTLTKGDWAVARHRAINVPENEQKVTSEGKIKAKYADGAWAIRDIAD
ncbi:hypothetical protein HMPREF3164_01215 [Rothia sp. HMSC08A08]|uniref:DUF6318 family protein n=1 Tax=Rothia sp. HMSC08A08 TaxID=1581132 RepID=UPI0008A5A9E6|nr:DUF6318 family protein [Rothia sp. HMSC08A08]OFS82346.1 hypothetical protein HMPREF3164_01215 [Rothia sp. HMSC08A08]